MRGDFSNWRFDRLRNFNGVLHQQGRVITDRDFTDGERIALHWREEAARDVIGADIAAVPATEPNGFHVVEAGFSLVANQPTVTLKVEPGRAWVDGLLTYLPGDPDESTAPVLRRATYFELPVQPPPANPTAGDRDVVVLEASHQEMNGFQVPQLLLDPALGDLDTTERVHTSFRFRLFRLSGNQDCHSIGPLLEDDPAIQGKLTATLTPTAAISGDCPVVEGGGYTGMEHHLYRIEIADRPAAAAPHFKFSRLNGGLVGRGIFDAAVNPKRVAITANRAAIVNAGQTDFYLEALQFDVNQGCWRTAYGAFATLDGQDDLTLTDPPFFGTLPAGGASVFFRLWDGLRPVSGFTNVANPEELVDGIHLRFDPPNGSGSNYRPGDYWTFSVRVGQSDPSTLVPNRPSEGIRYHRVPLAEIRWSVTPDIESTNLIEDCRSRFLPLTSQRVCCTLLVGDGISTFGDFNSLEEAAAALPPAGGELCLLPGVHFANLRLEGRHNVVVHGCARRTLVLPRPDTKSNPILHIRDSRGIKIAGLDLVSFDGVPILAEGSDDGSLKDLTIEETRILGCRGCIRVDRGSDVQVARNALWVLDRREGRAALSVEADRVLIERNRLAVWPAAADPPGVPPPGEGEETPTDPCADSDLFLKQPGLVVLYAHAIWAIAPFDTPPDPYQAIGGIHIRAGSEDVLVLENHIQGGAGNGITLGGVLLGDLEKEEEDEVPPPEDSGKPLTLTAVTKSRFIGFVVDSADQPVPNVDVHLVDTKNGQSFSDITDSQGRVEIDIPPGTYDVRLSPTHEIVEFQVDQNDDTIFARLVVRERPASPRDESAFLYRIVIRENDITSMGLSGIGFGTRAERWLPGGSFTAARGESSTLESQKQFGLSALTPRDLLSVSDPVDDLVIRGNRIYENLRNAFDEQMLEGAKRIGRGGISLAVCRDVVISDNHILDNGSRPRDPACGVFVGYGDNLEIGANEISDNGPMTAGEQPTQQEGLRGGIFIRFAGPILTLDSRGPSARVHDNRVNQPAGRALTIFAWGPVSCADNFLSSAHTGRWALLDVLVGGALIVNFGGVQRLLKNAYVTPTRLLSNEAGNAPQSDFLGFKSAERVLPGGETVFHGNQVRLGLDHRSITAILIGALDDVGFTANQSSVFHSSALLTNTALAGFTVRVTDSRFMEVPDDTWSLFSLYFRSTIAAHNIADHCILVRQRSLLGGGNFDAIVGPNVEHDFTFCQRFKETGAQDEYVEAFVANLFQGGVAADVASATTVAGAASVVHEAQLTNRHVATMEAARLARKHGPNSAAVTALKQNLDGGVQVMQNLYNQSEVVLAKPVSPPEGGAAVTARVTDSARRGVGELTLELVNPDDKVVHVLGKTDTHGNLARELDSAIVAGLQRSGDLAVRITDASRREVMRLGQRFVVRAGETVGVNVVLPTKRSATQRIPTDRTASSPGDTAAVRPPPSSGERPPKEPDAPPAPGGSTAVQQPPPSSPKPPAGEEQPTEPPAKRPPKRPRPPRPPE